MFRSTRQRGAAVRRSRPVLAVLVACAALLPFAAGAAEFLPPMGGPGGNQYIEPCPAGQLLTGFELRVGADIDAIRPLCVTPYGANLTSEPVLTNAQAQPGWHGGNGGHVIALTCPPRTPAILGAVVQSEGREIVTANNVHLYCGLAVVTPQTAATYPSAVFDAENTTESNSIDVNAQVRTEYGRTFCPPGQIAVGVHGRAGEWVDAIGLMCGQVAWSKSPYVALGRVQTTPSASDAQVSICERARDARARNSPAAPGLERQCEATKAKPVALGRVSAPPEYAAPERSLCTSARDARARNSPAAPGLEKQCRSYLLQQMPGIEARGVELIQQDPLAQELLAQQPAGPAQRGFAVAIAVAGRDTADGPGKQQKRDVLSQPAQAGYNVGLWYSLNRNRAPELAAAGVAIAQADPEVAAKRDDNRDVYFRLGFDFASGIFGDPALGGRGESPASAATLALRDSLPFQLRVGFEYSMGFHLGRAR